MPRAWTGGGKFNPDWLMNVGKFGTLRFMGWMPTNGETLTSFSQLADENYIAWCQPFTATSDYGPKGSLHPSLICQVAKLTNASIHVCIPHLATDEFVRAFASYFRDNLPNNIVVTFEYSNECWNWQFPQTHYCQSQGTAIWPGDAARFAKWYGYRSAQCMNIVRQVFNDRTRWRGCIATQTVWAAITSYAISGAQTAMTSLGLSGGINTLFNEISVTGYFGDIQTSVPLSGITNSSPAVVTSPSHGYVNGTRLRLFVNSGITQLNNKTVVVGNATRDTFELVGVDTTSYPVFAAGNNYAVPSAIFDLMDTSEALYQQNPSSYPTKYTYFNSVMAASWLSGSAAGITTFVNVAALKSTFWPAQKTIATQYGLELRQYEGGLHFVGDGYLTGYGGNPRFTEFLLAVGHSKETAAVYAQCYAAFFAIGGVRPAKFVEGGINTQYGVWAGLRSIPGDESNPVWQETLKANGSTV